MVPSPQCLQSFWQAGHSDSSRQMAPATLQCLGFTAPSQALPHRGPDVSDVRHFPWSVEWLADSCLPCRRIWISDSKGKPLSSEIPGLICADVSINKPIRTQKTLSMEMVGVKTMPKAWRKKKRKSHPNTVREFCSVSPEKACAGHLVWDLLCSLGWPWATVTGL